MPTELNNRDYINDLTGCIERIVHVCQHHSLVEPRLAAFKLFTKIKNSGVIETISNDYVAEINHEYDQIRRSIRNYLVDDKDIHKHTECAKSLIEDAIWLLNKTSDRLPKVTRTIAEMKRHGMDTDDFNAIIAMATIVVSRDSMTRQELKNTAIYIIQHDCENDPKAKHLLDDKRDLVQRLGQLDKALDTYPVLDNV